MQLKVVRIRVLGLDLFLVSRVDCCVTMLMSRMAMVLRAYLWCRLIDILAK